MKTINISKSIKFILTLALAFLCLATISFAQEADAPKEKDKRPVRAPFESALLIDNQTFVVPSKGTLEFDIIHRFGTLENGVSDLFGMWASSNIRLGLTYTIIDDLSLGFGTTKFDKLVDFNVKYNFMKQTRSWSTPVSMTFFGSAAIDTREDIYTESAHKWSYFGELIIGAKINKELTIQLSPSMSHYNVVDSLYSNDIFAIAFDGRYKLSSTTSILFQYIQPLNQHDALDSDGSSLDLPRANIGVGIEMSTSSHAFQIFFANYQGIQYQKSIAFNKKDFSDGGSAFLLGFNITRLWNF